ncbi:MAG: hypothetical protein AB7P76_04715 [Candidatus Melainabacteria bacterium]
MTSTSARFTRPNTYLLQPLERGSNADLRTDNPLTLVHRVIRYRLGSFNPHYALVRHQEHRLPRWQRAEALLDPSSYRPQNDGAEAVLSQIRQPSAGRWPVVKRLWPPKPAKARRAGQQHPSGSIAAEG